MTLAEPIQVTLQVAKALKQLAVRYLVGGSLASSLHGIPRATQDVDLVAELEHAHVDKLVAKLGPDFYVDPDMIHDAIDRRASFNIIHLKTMLKVDIFVSRDDAFGSNEFNRRQTKEIEGEQLVIASAEDIVIEKLRWFQLGDGVSERQYKDVLGVLKVQGNDIDLEYLKKWSTTVGVANLLEQALGDAGMLEDDKD